MNIQISKEFVSFKPATSDVCKRLNLRKATLWLIFLSEIIDFHKTSKKIKTKSVEVYELLLKKVLVNR